MEKIKNMFSPGHAQDDQKLYASDGSSTNPTTAAQTQQHVSPHTGQTTGHANDLDETAANASRMPGSSNMPGGFEDENTPLSGAHSSTTHPTSALGSSTGTGATTSQHGSGAPHIPAQHFGADDGASTTSIKSGIPGNTTHSGTTGSALGDPTGTSSGLGGTSSTTSDPHGSSTTGASRLQDPVFSNRNMHSGNPAGTSSTSGIGSGAGASALGSAGLGAAGSEAAHHHNTSGTSGLTGSHPSSGLTGSHPSSGLTGSNTSSGLTGSQPSSGLTGSNTSSGLTGSHPSSGLTGSHPSSGLTGASGTTSTLPDRTAPHANVSSTTTDRAFPLGGHTGEGPHITTTANRLDPRVADSGDEFRHGTHHHQNQYGTDSGLTSGTTGSGVGSGLTSGHNSTHPTSGLTGSSTTTSSAPHGSSTGNPTDSSTHGGHHLGRDVALGTGAAGLGATGAHELSSGRGTHGVGSTGTTTGTGSGLTSSGSGQQYDTLSDGTPSGISTRDPAHSSTVPSSTSGTHGSSNLGRDAALGAGAAGVGSHSHGSHGHHGTSGTGGVGQTYNTLSDGTPSGIATRDAAHPSTGPSSTTGTSSHGGNHLGRDAALGGGAAGLGGAAYEASKHHGTGHTSTSTNPASAAGGHGLPSSHKYNDLGDGTPSGIASTNPAHPSSHTPHVPGSSSTRDPTSTTGSSGHHYGRDAGLGAAGVGAGGLAAHEAGKHHGAPTQGTTGTSTLPGTATTQHAPAPGNNIPTAVHGSSSTTHPTGSAASRAQDTLSSHPGQTGTHASHTGRDAGAVAGVGGVGGATAYEAEKHKHGSSTDPNRVTSHGSHASHDSSGKKPGLVDKILGRDPAEKEAKQHEKEMVKAEKQHEKEVKQHDKEIAKAEKQHDKDAKHHDKDAKKEEKQYEKELKKEETHGHTGEAALAGAGAGGVGATGYEASQHHGQTNPTMHSTNRTTAVPGTGTHGQEPFTSPTTGNTYDTAGGKVPTHATTGSNTTSSHLGRDAGLTGSSIPGSTSHQYGGTDNTPLAHGASSGHTDPTHHSHTGRDAALAGTSATGVGGAGYGAEKLADPSSGTHTGSSVAGSGTQRYGGTDGTPLPHSSHTSSGAAGVDPRVDSAQYGSSTHGTGHSTSSPTSATSGEKKPGLMDKLLHRDDPNKLSKEAGTSHHAGSGSGNTY